MPSSPTTTASSPSSSDNSDRRNGYGSIPIVNNMDETSPLMEKSFDGNVPRTILFVNDKARRVFLGALLGIVVVWIGTILPHHGGSRGIRIQEADSNENESSTLGKPSTSKYSSQTGLSLVDDSFSISPVQEMDMLGLERQDDALPSEVWGSNRLNNFSPLPTNSWYLNLVSHRAAYQPNDQTRVYTVPYIIDTASPFPGMEGLRVHWPVVKASSNNVQMVNDFKNALCLGAEGFDQDNNGEPRYTVSEGPLSHLGVGLEWAQNSMSTNVVRGMPYATMEYNTTSTASFIPTIYSYNGLASDVQVDRSAPFAPSINKVQNKLVCGTSTKKGTTVSVQSHLHLHINDSDFTWMVFFSKPVKVSCDTPNGQTDPDLQDFKLAVHPSEENDESSSLVIRVALLDQCTTGEATIKEHCSERNAQKDPEGYERLLKAHAHVLPKSPSLDFEYSSNNGGGDDEDVAKISIDWDATSANNNSDILNDSNNDLLVFGLPHHLESLASSSDSTNITDYCVHSFHGNTCLVKSSNWVLEEALGTPLSFVAPRPPTAELIPTLAKYLAKDIHFKLSDNTMRGASDTYFSGKTLARLARIVVIAKELEALASASSASDVRDLYSGDDFDDKMLEDSIQAAASATLPSSQSIDKALTQLQIAVTVWLRSNAEAPYIYDQSWGGLVNCGCKYVGHDDRGHCENTFPDCPALEDVNEDFGNGYYNDHHYHYGYHVYAAAVAAKFGPSWGRKHFDEVMLYIRDFANPYESDPFFPQYRNKDWFLGSSWASGIVSAENSPHGRNEESSSEAISAYEGVTLFGSAMVEAFENVKDDDWNDSLATKLETAKLIRGSGQLLTASEIHATNRYWHVWSSDTHNNTYPAAYTQPVVGMLYDTMATFQTWFAPWAVVSYGIQLIPLTPVAETRDDMEWATELYPLYEKACSDAGSFCEKNGWSILQAGLLATTGNQDEALEQAKAVPSEVFTTEGGIGNSMSNTIWYIATRKQSA